jgi:hypothetical protein
MLVHLPATRELYPPAKTTTVLPGLKSITAKATLEHGAETLVLEEGSTGKLEATYTEISAIFPR